MSTATGRASRRPLPAAINRYGLTREAQLALPWGVPHARDPLLARFIWFMALDDRIDTGAVDNGTLPCTRATLRRAVLQGWVERM